MRARVNPILAWLLPVFLWAEAAEPKHVMNVSNYLGSVSGLGIKGNIVTAKTWMESGDSCALLIREVQHGETFDKGYVSAIYGNLFTKKAAQWKKGWTIQEVNRSSVEIIRYDSASLRIIDVDGNGIAETLFFYTVGYDSGTEPTNLKMIFHWNRIKMPIRGKIPVELNQPSAYRMELDAKLRSAPDTIREFAVGQWKSYMKAHYEDLFLAP